MPHRRILYVWLPHWPITRLRRHSPEHASPGNPIATVETVRGVRRLAEMCETAAALGLYSGQTLAMARTICPRLMLADADPEGDRAALQALASWCERYTPLVAADPPDGLWLDIAGCAHLFRDEAGLAATLADRLARAGIPGRLAVASTTGAAWALARWVACEHAPEIAAAGEEQAKLESLPVGVLRLEQPVAAALRELGLRTIGDLLRVPRTELTLRFGKSVLLRLDQSLGAEEEIIRWQHKPQGFEVRLAFAEPISAPEDLVEVLMHLAEQLCRLLTEKRLGGHRFVCRLYRVDDAVLQIELAAALPVNKTQYLAKLLVAKLEFVDPGFGIEVATLAATDVAPCPPSQCGLLGSRCDGSGQLAELLDTLGNRLGNERLWQLALRESHVPERAITRTPPLAACPIWPTDPSRPRPIRLLCRPEPIQVTALVPDDPPLTFRWRGTLHRVRAAAGPERVAAEWWRSLVRNPDNRPETDLLRDYYRIEDDAGSRFWVFRACLNNGRQWFLHGVFG